MWGLIIKFGTTYAAVSNTPEKYPKSFGEFEHLTEDELCKAEQFLVTVFSRANTKTVDTNSHHF